MQPTTPRMAGLALLTTCSFVYRENRVPHYQRLFQKVDGVRQWQKTPKSNLYLKPYYFLLFTGTAGSLWMMGRMVMGHKTWFSGK
ncbi:hypothetical protein BT63DRAFT_143401 [Microthyrium microscopicum]|uniref:Uncharacterized protein n=1 Tax=Microthyrium microscopicum TaxID=703497 RepID=A0A6A6UNH1_9PEZI|nr:hypothetical protein BT63DRAFT_143401 [Microthyrium microscopicum]